MELDHTVEVGIAIQYSEMGIAIQHFEMVIAIQHSEVGIAIQHFEVFWLTVRVLPKRYNNLVFHLY